MSNLRSEIYIHFEKVRALAICCASKRERERPTNRPDEVGSAYVVYMPLGGRDGEGREEYGDGRRAGKEGD